MESILTGHSNGVYSLLALEQEKIISGSADGTVKVWNRSSIVLTLNTLNSNSIQRHLVILSNGLLASSSSDGSIRVWNYKSGLLMKTLVVDNQYGINSLCSLGDDKFAASSDNPIGIVKVWDSISGQLVFSLAGHLDSVQKIILSSRGNLLFSVSIDGRINAWNHKNGSLLYSLLIGTNKLDGIVTISILPKGRLTTATLNNKIQVWYRAKTIKST